MLLKDIQTPLSALKGIGEASAALFARLGVATIGDLLMLYPREYDDRTRTVQFCDWAKERVHCAAVVVSHEWLNDRHHTLCLVLSDGFMDLRCVAFGRAFLEKAFPVGVIACITAKVEQYRGMLQTTSFELVKLPGGEADEWRGRPLPDIGVYPIYPLTEGLKQKNVRKALDSAIRGYASQVDDEVPAPLIEKYRLLHKKDALRLVHQPQTMTDVDVARQTLIYEELFVMCCAIAHRTYLHRGELPEMGDKASNMDITRVTCAPQAKNSSTIDEVRQVFIASLSPKQKGLLDALPFPLTLDQMKVITEMNADIDRGYNERTALIDAATNSEENNVNDADIALPVTDARRPPFTMQRLLQGDVGSGKTLVAFFVCLRVIDLGDQCAFVAPTELVAQQHAQNASLLLGKLGVNVAFFTGNVKNKQRSLLLSNLIKGNIDIVIGTHAVFSSQVHYHRLGMAVIDEQHKFGVMQRQAIMAKGHSHLLMMSATPIPQSLALTIFGDLDVSTIHTMPAGRLPVTTYLVREGNERNAYEAVRREMQKGHQAYFVYPAIEAGESRRKSAEEAFDFLQHSVYPEYRLALLHSKLGEDESEKVIEDFRAGRVKALAATTVVEVGVDVPNATCIVIEGADYFGMAQLHQLRGRVGRGKAQSYCFLIYGENITDVGIKRMKALRESTDGFFLAEEDLRLRGPGEVTGTMQSGMLKLGIADIERDIDTLLTARADAFNYVREEISS